MSNSLLHPFAGGRQGTGFRVQEAAGSARLLKSFRKIRRGTIHKSVHSSAPIRVPESHFRLSVAEVRQTNGGTRINKDVIQKSFVCFCSLLVSFNLPHPSGLVTLIPSSRKPYEGQQNTPNIAHVLMQVRAARSLLHIER
jgi:hypothetical protein